MKKSRRRDPRQGVQTLRVGCTGRGQHDWIPLGTAERRGQEGHIWIDARAVRQERLQDWHLTSDNPIDGVMRETKTFRCRDKGCGCTVPMVVQKWQDPLRKLLDMGETRLDISNLPGYAPSQ